MTASWWEGPLVGFDTETTGIDVETDRIVTACVVLVDSDGTVSESRDWLLDPGVAIPEQATAVHGVTTERARAEGADAAQGVASIIATLRQAQADGIPVVGFNVVFDLTLLDREARRYGIEPLDPHPVIDARVLDKQVDRYRRGKRTLGACCEVYGVQLDDAHTADADALAAVEVARAIGRREPHPPSDPSVLHQGQIAWHAEHCASLEDYFRRTKDPHAVVAREWPVLPLPQEKAA